MNLQIENNNKLELLPCKDNNEWDTLLSQSNQNNVFMKSKYLESQETDGFRRILHKNGNPIIGLLLNSDLLENELSHVYNYSTYHSIFLISKKNIGYSTDLEIIEQLGCLTQIFDKFSINCNLSLHHSLLDIRGIEWYFYANQTRLNFKYDVKYTGIIETSKFKDFDEYLKSIRNVRLQQFKKGKLVTNLRIVESTSVEEFCRIYRLTFKKHDKTISEDKIALVRSIIASGLKYGYGKLYLLVTDSETAISGIFILKDQKTDYYQFGANDPAFLNKNGSTILLLHAIKESFDSGQKNFDMVGMNSPLRGEFKASFNARSVPYFEIKFSQKLPAYN